MPQLPLYEDSLVVLTSDSLLLKRYYFPTLKPKVVSLAEVQRIEILCPNLWTGRFRLWGSGDLENLLSFGSRTAETGPDLSADTAGQTHSNRLHSRKL